jgi:hypothetical protein
MSSHLDPAYREYLRLAQNLPAEACLKLAADILPPVEMPSLELNRLNPLTHAQCACDKRVPVGDLKVRKSLAGVPYLDNLCAGCVNLGKGLAVVICVKCHRVVGRMEPSKDGVGFAFKADKVYHVERCPMCAPGSTFSPIVEKILHDRRLGRRA